MPRGYVEQTWGWDETVQRRMFADAFGRQARRIIQVAGQDVGVLVVEERPDEQREGLRVIGSDEIHVMMPAPTSERAVSADVGLPEGVRRVRAARSSSERHARPSAGPLTAFRAVRRAPSGRGRAPNSATCGR